MNHTVNGKGSAAGWAGTWGPMGDGRSRVARLRKKIRQELEAEFSPRSPLLARLADMAATDLALVEQTTALMGRDPKATRRALTALQRAADAKLAALATYRAERPPTDPLAALLRAGVRRR